MIGITQAEPRDGFRVHLCFSDGQEGIVDLAELVGRGVFSAWENRDVFEAVSVTPSGDLEWPDGLDLCADALYLRLTGGPGR